MTLDRAIAVALTSPSALSKFIDEPAEVVELVDALASGASGRKLVGVRVPPSAYEKERRVCFCQTRRFASVAMI
jgi:hypothetical protein